MKAIVRLINPLHKLFAAELEGGGEIILFKFFDTPELEIGDILSVQITYFIPDGITLHNLTKECKFDVICKNICNESNMRKLCLL